MTLCFEKDERFTCHVENVKRAGSLGEGPGKKPLCTRPSFMGLQGIWKKTVFLMARCHSALEGKLKK